MKKATLIAVLIGIGVEKATAEKMASLTPDEGTDALTPDEITKFNTDWKTNQRALLENDPELLKKVRSDEHAKNMDKAERRLKQIFSLTQEEVEGKKYDEIVEIAKKKMESMTNADSKELQKKLLDLENEKKKWLEEEKPALENAGKLYEKNFNIKQKFRGMVTNDKDKLRLPHETALKLVEMDLQDKYDLDLDESGELVIYNKGTKTLAKNNTQTAFLKMDEFISERLEAHGAIQKSNAKPNEKKKEDIIEPGGQVVKTPAQLKAEKNLAEMEERNKS